MRYNTTDAEETELYYIVLLMMALAPRKQYGSGFKRKDDCYVT
jgi:hypothetical protein